jgi:peptidoglycan hydrolase-like protein with peptidoglycan-binding domain
VALALIPSTSGGSTACTLRRGNINNAAVRILQNALNRCARVKPSPLLKVDGDFGTLTETAVRNEQRSIHEYLPNTIDGIYGPTWDRDSFLWPIGPATGSDNLPKGACDVTWVP